MLIKATLLAVVLFLSSLTFVEAQTYVNGGVPSPGTVLGWNFGLSLTARHSLIIVHLGPSTSPFSQMAITCLRTIRV